MIGKDPVNLRDFQKLLAGHDEMRFQDILEDLKISKNFGIIEKMIKTINEKIVRNINSENHVELISIGDLKTKNHGKYSKSYIKKIIGELSMYFEKLSTVAAAVDDPGEFARRRIHVGLTKGDVRLSWMPYRSGRVVSSSVPEDARVVILGRLLKTAFSTDFMRGARSMARELGVVLKDHRTIESDLGSDDTNEFLNKINPKSDVVVLYFNQQTGETEEILLGLKANKIEHINVGYDVNDGITVDYAELAKKLATHLTDTIESGRENDKVILLHFNDLHESHPLRVRDGAYTYYFASRAGLKIEKFPLKYDIDNDSTDANGFELIDKLIESDGDNIVAILGRSHNLTLGVIKSVLNHNKSNIKVFGENISADLVACLNDENGPLEAICSVDPYYMGRYVVRAALVKLVRRECDRGGIVNKIQPIIIKRRHLYNGTIHTIDRLPDVVNDDVRLDHPEFAWPEWMKERCRFGYGPRHYREPNA